MNELVHSLIRKSPLASLRSPSFAGRGLPERMRSTAFALLGLTAAAGLALVAIFAQPGSSLLDPAPLPAEPRTHLAGAMRVTHPDGPERLVAAKPAAGFKRTSTVGDGGPVGSGGASAGVAPPVPSAPTTSTPVEAPAPAAPEGGDGSGSRGAASQPAPSPSPASSPEGVEPPASSPADGSASPASPPATQPAPAPPKATTSSPTPPQPVAPGNSASGAAAEHASERGIEASASSAPAPAPSAEPETGSSPGNGNGYAKGQNK
jgi:hypothetical protein